MGTKNKILSLQLATSYRKNNNSSIIFIRYIVPNNDIMHFIRISLEWKEKYFACIHVD